MPRARRLPWSGKQASSINIIKYTTMGRWDKKEKEMVKEAIKETTGLIKKKPKIENKKPTAIVV